MTEGAIEAVTRALNKAPRKRPTTLSLALNQSQTTTQIFDAVEAFFGVTHREIMARGRVPHLSTVRHVAAWLMWQSGMSFSAIGRAIDNRDHTTIMAAVRRIEKSVRCDPETQRTLLDVVQLWRVQNAKTK